MAKRPSLTCEPITRPWGYELHCSLQRALQLLSEANNARLVVLVEIWAQNVVLRPSSSSIVFVPKVLLDTLAASDSFNLTRCSVDKICINSDVASLLNSSEDKIFAIGADHPVLAVRGKCARLNSKAHPALGCGFTELKN